MCRVGVDVIVADAIAAIPVPDESWGERAWARLDSLTKPPRSLGLLEDLAQRVAVLQRTETPAIPRKAMARAEGRHADKLSTVWQ